MKILFVGDIVGRPGREAIMSIIPRLKDELNIEFVIANAENVAGGSGITPRLCSQLLAAGVDVLTSGDHIWRRQEVLDIIAIEPRLLRPLNLKPDVPGRGWNIFKKDNNKIAVVNLQGRVFMEPIECPFVYIKDALEEIKKETNLIIVDMHAEATSEKIALSWFLEGKVTLVAGTHTHVQTADEKILGEHTAYITDVGMTGPMDSVIGRRKDKVLEMFVTGMPTRFEVATSDVRLQAVLVEADPDSGRARSIERIEKKLLRED